MNERDLPYVVEPMQTRDIQEVMEIERESFSMPWSYRAYRYEIEDNRMSTYLVARVARQSREPSFWDRFLETIPLVEPHGPVVGYCGFWMMVDEAHISTIAVAPDYRGRGIGELMLLRMIEIATEKGAAVVTLEVRISNEHAQRLYEKYGFTIQGRRVRYYSDNGEDAYIMTTPRITTQSYREQLALLRQHVHEHVLRAAPSEPGKSPDSA